MCEAQWFSDKLRAWFLKNGRKLPWRNAPSPYQVWVSEIMLQQTQVATVIPYYERWMQVFPDVEALAKASVEDVLKLWSGLGYYRRARYLHSGAKVIVEQFHGGFPSNPKELRKIPGIGEYTAGAIASFAFHLDVPAIDGNAERVLSRYFGILGDIYGTERNVLIKTANAVASCGHCADVNQGIMDLGASLCGKSAQCTYCPLVEKCFAHNHDCVQQLPKPKTRIEKIEEFRAAICIQALDGRILIAQRRPEMLLGGLWEFPMIVLSRGKGKKNRETALHKLKEPRDVLWQSWGDGHRIEIAQCFSTALFVSHTFTHIQMRVDLDKASCAHPHVIAPTAEYEAFQWVKPQEIEKRYPVSTLMKKILAQYCDCVDAI